MAMYNVTIKKTSYLNYCVEARNETEARYAAEEEALDDNRFSGEDYDSDFEALTAEKDEEYNEDEWIDDMLMASY